jgi:hypothetical protein
MVILTWIGVVLGLTTLLLMAFGPAIAEADTRRFSWPGRRSAERSGGGG